MSRHHEFSEAALAELLRALRVRSATRPENPGLVASFPAVREDRMAAACTELQRRGHAVQRVPNGRSWALGVATKELSCP
jgi:hypothetical protein